MFEEPRDPLYLLQPWYLTQCDDLWEHAYGIEISTLVTGSAAARRYGCCRRVAWAWERT